MDWKRMDRAAFDGKVAQEVKAHMNMYDWAKEKESLVEVIYACMDGMSISWIWNLERLPEIRFILDILLRARELSTREVIRSCMWERDITATKVLQECLS